MLVLLLYTRPQFGQVKHLPPLDIPPAAPETQQHTHKKEKLINLILLETMITKRRATTLKNKRPLVLKGKEATLKKTLFLHC